MVATVHVFFDFGGSDTMPGTEQDTDALTPVNLRFKTADDSTIDSINPIPIPTGAENSSFWKQIYLEVTATGGFSQIDNVQFYTDGTNFGTGILMNVGNELPTHNLGSQAGYEVATGTIGTNGDDLVASHAGITAVTDAFTFVSACTKTVSISEAGAIINVINESTDYLAFQMEVSNTASPGDLADETWTYQYDEI